MAASSRLRSALLIVGLPALVMAAAIAGCAAEQPERVPPPDDWQTFAGEGGITFSYPADLATRYIHTVDWPPDVAVHRGPFTCTEAGTPTARAGRTERVRIDEREYCVTRIVEGAAGSIYTLHAWAVPRDDRVIILTFSVRAVQCGNYDEQEQNACDHERRTFDIVPLIDRIAQTIGIDTPARPSR